MLNYIGSNKLKAKSKRIRKKRLREFTDEGLEKNTGILYSDQVDGGLVPRLVIPSMIRDDIRNYYGSMISHVYNSQNYEFMSKFLMTYFRPDVMVIQQLFGK